VFYVLTEPESLADAKATLKGDLNQHAIEFPSDFMGVADADWKVDGYLKGVDLALLTMADCSIVTYGTFGHYGALLGKPKVEVVRPAGHPANKEINDAELENWTTLEYTIID